MTILMKAVNATVDQIYAVLMHGECSNKLPLPDELTHLDKRGSLIHLFFWGTVFLVALVQGTACPCSSWRH